MRTSLTATTEKKMFLEPIVPGSTSTVLQEMILSRTRSVLDISHEDTRKLWKILSAQRERVLTRHRTLLWTLHTMEHHFDVHGRLCYLFRHLVDPKIFPDRMRLLMLEAAFRHDDGHVGKMHRQTTGEWRELSNEEMSVLLAEVDFRDAEEDIDYLDFSMLWRLILSTTSNQDEKTVGRNSPLYREYTAETIEEKFLVFADVGWCLLSWWEHWMQEGDNFYDEEGISKDRDQNWLDSRRAFLAYVWKLYTDDIQDTLDATTREEIEANYRQITQELGKIERQIGGA